MVVAQWVRGVLTLNSGSVSWVLILPVGVLESCCPECSSIIRSVAFRHVHTGCTKKGGFASMTDRTVCSRGPVKEMWLRTNFRKVKWAQCKDVIGFHFE